MAPDPQEKAAELSEKLPEFRFPTEPLGWAVVVVSAVAGLVTGGLTINAVAKIAQRIAR